MRYSLISASQEVAPSHLGANDCRKRPTLVGLTLINVS
jgi:hypothetical protein